MYHELDDKEETCILPPFSLVTLIVVLWLGFTMLCYRVLRDCVHVDVVFVLLISGVIAFVGMMIPNTLFRDALCCRYKDSI